LELQDFRKALVQSNPAISRYNPLSRIMFFDDFDNGINGWCELIGNHLMGNLDTVRPIMRDFRPPQLSNCSFFDIGTHGSMDGTYALKLATRPSVHHMSTALKRVTMANRSLVQLEAYFTFKAETVFSELQESDRQAASRNTQSEEKWDGNFDPSILDFGDFSFSNDICEGENGARYHCVLRYVNTDFQGNLVQKWMYKTSVQQTTKIQLRHGATAPTDYHTLNPDDWAEVPGGHQPLCYNEVPTKINWHYLRWLFDTRKRKMTELQVNDLLINLRDIPVPRFEDRYTNLENLLNLIVDVRTHRNVRNFLYLDSVLVSVDW